MLIKFNTLRKEQRNVQKTHFLYKEFLRTILFEILSGGLNEGKKGRGWSAKKTWGPGGVMGGPENMYGARQKKKWNSINKYHGTQNSLRM